MNSEQMSSMVEDRITSLNAHCDGMDKEADELEAQAKSLRELATDERERMVDELSNLEKMRTFCSDTKSLEEMADNSVSKSDVKEVIDGLQGSGIPDFSGAKVLLGIEDDAEGVEPEEAKAA